MQFNNRETEFPGKKKLVKVDSNNVPLLNEEPILVNILKDEGAIYEEGTPISAENLTKGNWRDDESVSFKKRNDNNLPDAKVTETQIVTKSSGETWLIPPSGLGLPKEIGAGSNSSDSNAGTSVKVNNVVQEEVNFTTDPQIQITASKNAADIAQNTADSKSVVKINGVKADVEFTSNPQVQITAVLDAVSSKSIVKVNNVKTDVNFKAEPQAQLNSIQSITDTTFKTSLLNAIYPIGAVYMSVNSTNPTVLFGGTWSAWGAGRMPLGMGSTQSNNDGTGATPSSQSIVERTGGNEKLQNHTHSFSTSLTNKSLIGHLTYKTYNDSPICTGAPFTCTFNEHGVTPAGSVKDRNVTVKVDMEHAHSGTTGVTGAGAASSAANGNIPPYITCYMWKRTA